MEGPVFFVSYSRKNGGDELDRFVDRLERAVQQHLSADGPVSFFDKSDIEPGADWSEALEDALGRAQAFVAIYSPAYFESEYCGKEWAAFASRYEDSSGRSGQPPVFPVLWVPMGPDDLPEAVRRVQYTHGDFGETYTSLGLWRLSERQHAGDHEAFVNTLAAKIGERVQESHLVPKSTRLALGSIPSAFGEGGLVWAKRERALRGKLEDYFRAVWARSNPIKMQAIRETGAGRQNLQLSAVYTTLHVNDEVRLGGGIGGERGEVPDLVTLPVKEAYEKRLLSVAREAYAQVQEGEGGIGSGRPRYSRKLTALEAAAGCPRLVLLGAAGSGKSTFAKHLALAMAGQVLDWSGASLESLNRPSGDAPWTPAYRAWLHGALVPVFVELQDFVGSDAFPETEDHATAENLFQYLESREVDPIKPAVLERIRESIKDDEALLILDGLDETPKEGVRGRLREVITRFTETYPECRVLVTSRPYAYEESDEWRLDGAGFEVSSLEPLDPPAVEFFVRAWFRQLVARKLATAREAQHRERRLLDTIGTEAYMEPLVASPLMLTMVADLSSSGESTFRGGRSALYEKSTELLLDRWNEVNRKEGIHKLSEVTGMPLEAIRNGLESLACSVHESRGRESDPKKQLIAHTEIWDELEEARPEIVKRLDLAELTSYLNERSGILLADEKKRYRFPHRSFQEFLASCWLLADNDYPDTLIQRVGKDAQLWKEVFLFAAEREGETASRFYTLLDALIPDDPQEAPDIERMRIAILAGDALVRTGRYRGELGRHASKLARIRKWLTHALTEASLDAPARAESGRYLGAIGDMRSGVGLHPDGVPDIDWVDVPEGAFPMGSSDADDGAWDAEKPQRQLDLPAYQISRYPITNRQYGAFVEDGGYSDQWRRCWTDTGWDWREQRQVDGPDDELHETLLIANHPRVGVSWYEAMAYCGWLTERLGREVRLPTEAQWEKSARGTDGRIYPWGDEFDSGRCNGSESGIHTTSAVGMFPSGESPYGIRDASGNVFEWCSTEWREDYAADSDGAPEGGAARVLRGGSFDSDSWCVRCAYRRRVSPDSRINGVGFRVVAPVL